MDIETENKWQFLNKETGELVEINFSENYPNMNYEIKGEVVRALSKSKLESMSESELKKYALDALICGACNECRLDCFGTCCSVFKQELIAKLKERW